MTVAENMAFALRLRNMDKAEVEKRLNAAAEILSLTPYLKRYPRHLSGGQRQRVAMGRAIVRDPQVFLFDEPLSNLDAKLRVQMRAEIKELHQRLKTTTVFVTHDQVEAMTMADKIVVLQAGNVEQIGSPLELYDSPKNQFVATFIGSPSMNMIDGKIAKSGDDLVFSANGVELPISSDHKVKPGQKVTYGIRPEHLELADSGMPMTVKVLEPTGSETMVYLSFNEMEIVALFRERHNFETGQKIFLKPQEGKSHLFATDTGMAL